MADDQEHNTNLAEVDEEDEVYQGGKRRAPVGKKGRDEDHDSVDDDSEGKVSFFWSSFFFLRQILIFFSFADHVQTHAVHFWLL